MLVTGRASIRDVLLFPQMRALQTSRGQEVWRVSEPKGIFLGLDPAGKGHFGWSICRNESDKLAVVKTDLADNAVEAIKAVNRTMSDENLPKGTVLSAGIDAPLFWSKTGFREIDVTIRNAVKEARCPKPAGTVQAINSLRGACLVQGVLLADQLHRKLKCPITEAHPKALDWLDHSMRSCIIDLPPDCRDHERDATFAAYAAWCMHRKAQGWRNLFPKEPNPILPLGTPVSYWMPIPKQDPGQVNLNL